MEKLIDIEQKTLITELKQGKELAKQLWNHLQPSSQAAGILLIEKILSSYEKALSVLDTVALAEETKYGIGPRNEVSQQDTMDKDVFKKRKVMPQWNKQVKVCSGTGLEGPIDDGYSWRKYGQKDILGARYPRGYFRCSHRFAQGCLATKQVQKSDDDPAILKVTYRGRHTCNQISHSAATALAKEATNQHKKQPPPQQIPPKQEENPIQREDSHFNFGADGVCVKSENLDVEDGLFAPFPFPSPSIGSEIREDRGPFQENTMENEFVGSLSPTFQSPSASESDYLFGLCHTADQSLDSEFAGFITVPDSVTNIGDLEEYYNFDNLELFC